MQCAIKRIHLSLWLILISACNTCQAENDFSLNPMSLQSNPCLVSVSKIEYEWGTMDSGLCRGVTNLSVFQPIDNYDIQEKILWSNSISNPKHLASHCLQYRGHFNQLLETGESGCLCSGQQQNGLYDIGFEEQTRNGSRVCTTRNQSFDEYLVAKPNTFRIPEGARASDTPSTLGYIVYGSLFVFATIATCDIYCGVNLVNWTVGGVLTLMMVIRYRDLGLLSRNKL